VPHVSPGATAMDLVAPPDGGTEVPEQTQPSGERSFVRVIPDDGVQAEAAAAWARELGVLRTAAVSSGTDFGDQMTEEFAEEAAGLGIDVETFDLGDELPKGVELVYLGVEGVGQLRIGLPPLGSPDPPLMSSDALLDLNLTSEILLTASAQSPDQLPPAGQDFVTAFEDEYGRAPGPYAAYAYEAMALVLDAIERAGADAEDRRAVLDELLATRERESVLGTYSITPLGNTTLETIAGYRIEESELVFDEPLEP
jgi:branched-chain amino acid transport system substrate-binding protein